MLNGMCSNGLQLFNTMTDLQSIEMVFRTSFNLKSITKFVRFALEKFCSKFQRKL